MCSRYGLALCGYTISSEGFLCACMDDKQQIVYLSEIWLIFTWKSVVLNTETGTGIVWLLCDAHHMTVLIVLYILRLFYCPFYTDFAGTLGIGTGGTDPCQGLILSLILAAPRCDKHCCQSLWHRPQKVHAGTIPRQAPPPTRWRARVMRTRHCSQPSGILSKASVCRMVAFMIGSTRARTWSDVAIAQTGSMLIASNVKRNSSPEYGRVLNVEQCQTTSASWQILSRH